MFFFLKSRTKFARFLQTVWIESLCVEHRLCPNNTYAFFTQSSKKKEGNTAITMIFVGVDLLENSITVWIRKLNLILNLQNLIHSGSNIDIERSYEHFFSIQKVLQLVVISRVVLEIKPSNTRNDWKILSQRNTQNWR